MKNRLKFARCCSIPAYSFGFLSECLEVCHRLEKWLFWKLWNRKAIPIAHSFATRTFATEMVVSFSFVICWQINSFREPWILDLNVALRGGHEFIVIYNRIYIVYDTFLKAIFVFLCKRHDYFKLTKPIQWTILWKHLYFDIKLALPKNNSRVNLLRLAKLGNIAAETLRGRKCFPV